MKKGFKPDSLDPTLFTKAYDDGGLMAQDDKDSGYERGDDDLMLPDLPEPECPKAECKKSFFKRSSPKPPRRGIPDAFRFAGFLLKKTIRFKKKPRSFFFGFIILRAFTEPSALTTAFVGFSLITNVRYLTVRPFFFFVGFFSIFSQIRFLIESSILFNFSLVYRNQAIQAPRVSSRNSLSV